MSDELQMVEETFEPEKQYVVKDLETLKVIYARPVFAYSRCLSKRPARSKSWPGS